MAKVATTKPSREVAEHQARVSGWLHEHGWQRWPRGWRHPNLGFDWPMLDAQRLQQEADDGMHDAACASLRGDVWPV